MNVHIYSAPEIKAARKAMRLTQAQFWEALHVTQSGGSRYESGRDVPEPVQVLLNLVLGTDAKATAQLKELRASFAPKDGGAVRVPAEFGVLP